jgi:hypothetical protein
MRSRGAFSSITLIEKPALSTKTSNGPCLLMMVESWRSRCRDDTSRGSHEALGFDVISFLAFEIEDRLQDVALRLCSGRGAMALARLRPSLEEQPITRKYIADDESGENLHSNSGYFTESD